MLNDGLPLKFGLCTIDT